MGKTSFALNIAESVAVKSGKTVAIFSLEMSNEQLAQRLLSSQASIEGKCLAHRRAHGGRLGANRNGVPCSRKRRSIWTMTPGITVGEMKAKLRRLRKLTL